MDANPNYRNEFINDVERGQLKEAFMRIDIDKSGTLDFKELTEIVKVVGETMTEQEIHRLMDDADKDHNGCLDFDEFLDAVRFMRYRHKFMLKSIAGMSQYVEDAKKDIKKMDAERDSARYKEFQLKNFSAKQFGGQTASSAQEAERKERRKSEMMVFLSGSGKTAAQVSPAGGRIVKAASETSRSVSRPISVPSTSRGPLSAYKVAKVLSDLPSLIASRAWQKIKFSVKDVVLMGTEFLKICDPVTESLSFGALTKLVRDMSGSEISDGDVRHILTAADDDESGTIEFDEYLVVMKIIKYRFQIVADNIDAIQDFVANPPAASS